MNEQNWEDIVAEAQNIISICKPYISEDTILAVNNYLDHDEYEMAIEGLFIDIMELSVIPDDLTQKKCISLAQSVGLDKDSVFQDDFWERFLDYCHNKLKQ